MNNIRRKIKSIEKKTDIDVELKEIVDEMYDIYIKFSCFNILFMSGYYVKNIPDKVENTPVSKLQEEVRVVVDNHLGNREVTDESLERLLKIRENNCTLAESYSRYVDELSVYLELLNIREFDFGNKAKDFLADHTEPKVIDEIRNYILLGETDAQKKARYADIMPLIPEKITKNKLFNKIENFVKIFEGDLQSFESFAYKCRTAALAKSVDEKVQDAGIEAGLAKLREIDFDDFTEGDCEAAFLMAKKLIDDVDYVIDALYSSQEMINNIYAYSLLRRYVDANNLQGDKGLLTEEVIKYITGTIDGEQPDDKFTDKMDRMFADLVSDVSELHGISEVLMENAKRCGVDSDLVKSISEIIDIEKLFSSSVYAELEGDGDRAVSGDVVAMTGELINELDECLSKAPTSIRKILIKNINALMPASVDFSSSLEEYVMLNLFTARSDSERAFYVSEILEVIQSEKKEGDISDFLV